MRLRRRNDLVANAVESAVDAWHVRVSGRNGEIVTSSETYSSEWAADRAVDLLVSSRIVRGEPKRRR